MKKAHTFKKISILLTYVQFSERRGVQYASVWEKHESSHDIKARRDPKAMGESSLAVMRKMHPTLWRSWHRRHWSASSACRGRGWPGSAARRSPRTWPGSDSGPSHTGLWKTLESNEKSEDQYGVRVMLMLAKDPGMKIVGKVCRGCGFRG